MCVRSFIQKIWLLCVRPMVLHPACTLELLESLKKESPGGEADLIYFSLGISVFLLSVPGELSRQQS